METSDTSGGRRSGRSRRIALAAAVLCALGAGAWAVQRSGLVRRVYLYTDRSVLRESSSSTTPRSVLWSLPREVPLERPGMDDASGAPAAPRPAGTPPSFRPSAGTLVHAARNGPRGFDIFVAESRPAGWSVPVPFDEAAGGSGAAINTEHDELHPTLSADGRTLVFASDRPGGHGGADLYATRLLDDGWEAPRNLGGRINSPFDDASPTLDPSGRFLVFSTTRPRAFLHAAPSDWADVILSEWRPADPDLAAAELLDPRTWRWTDPHLLQGGSSAAREVDPCFSPSGEFLYFASDRAGGLGGLDLWRAPVEAADGPDGPVPRLGTPRNLGKPINSAFDETGPASFLDGFALAYVASDAASGSRIVLESRLREVDSSLELASMPLRAFLDHAARFAALAALALVFAVSTALFFRYRHVWQLSLVSRCALAALFVHALMLWGFYFWVVSEQIVALAKKDEPAEVTVERLLSARISMETNRLEVDVSAVRRARPEPSPLEARREASPRPLDAPEPVALEAAAATAEALDRTIVDLADAVPEAPSPLRPEDLADRPPGPEAVPVEELPEVSRREAAAAAEPSRPATLAASLKVESDAPAPGAPAAREERYESSRADPPDSGAIEVAATQVSAPTPPEPVLPPLARPVESAPSLVQALPVPEQAPASDVASPGEGLEPSPIAARIEETFPGESSAPEPPRVATSEPLSDPSPWSAQSTGMFRSDPDLRRAVEVPEAALLTAHRKPAPSASSARLPEARPVAEVATRDQRPAPETLRPRPGERHHADVASGGRASDALEAPTVALASAPLTAPSEAPDPVLGAAPLPLESLPRPGGLTEVAAMAPLPAADAPRPVLPEPGDGAEKPGRGSADPADLLAPRPSLARQADRRAASAEASIEAPSPAAVAGSEGPARPTEVASAVPAIRPAASGTGASLPRAALPSSGALGASERLVAAAVKLPEAPPELRGSRDPREYRAPEVRKVLVQQFGGSDESEAAVLLALRWLARHQSRDGRWDVDGFDAVCRGCKSPGFLVDCDAAVTALAVLCFLGQNHTPTNRESPFRRNVQDAIDWLVDGQTSSGLLARDDDRYTMYTHGIATLALSEAYLMTRDPSLVPVLRKAANVIVSSQNPETGGWRYRPEPPPRGDTSITGWQVLATKSLRSAGIEIPEAVFDRARHWLDEEVAGGEHGGIYGYTSPEEPRVAMVAEGMYARLLLGASRTDRNIEEAARYIHAETRGGRLLNNLYLSYYGNLALFNYQGWIWEQWNRQVREYLLGTQQRDGSMAGSWDPAGPWSETGGRVLSTCFAVLTLEVYYRYLPLYWQAEGVVNQGSARP